MFKRPMKLHFLKTRSVSQILTLWFICKIKGFWHMYSNALKKRGHSTNSVELYNQGEMLLRVMTLPV